jgi:DNA-binding NtrC family response regulator
MSIDILDELVLNLIIHSEAEKITIHDVNGYFKSNVFSGESKNDFITLFDKPLRDARDDFERMYFDFHLQNKYSVADLAKKTGIERTHLYRKLKQLKIKV